jgi:hypothetical protein
MQQFASLKRYQKRNFRVIREPRGLRCAEHRLADAREISCFTESL